MQDLKRRVELSRSRVSRLVDDLEPEGLVERSPDPSDGRATLAWLTPSRGALRRAGLPTRDRALLHGASRRGERATIASALQRVVDATTNQPT